MLTGVKPFADDLPVDDLSPMTPRSLAHLYFVTLVAELAEDLFDWTTIRQGMPLNVDFLEDVERLIAAPARRILETAVVAARHHGDTWESIGRALGIAKQTAHDRYAEAESYFEELLATGDVAAFADPAGTATQLDQWRSYHQQHRLRPGSTATGDPETQVSQGLERMSARVELMTLQARRSKLFSENFPVPLEVWDQMVALTEREQHIYEVLADRQRRGGRGHDNVESFAEQAMRARAYVSELRRNAEQARAELSTTDREAVAG